MGHLGGKDLYYKLSGNINNLGSPVQRNEAFLKILRKLYSETEADIVVRLPYSFSTLDRIQKLTKIDRCKLQLHLDKLCNKGMVIDICIEDTYYYMPAPFLVGIIEFACMRADIDQQTLANLIHEYSRPFMEGGKDVPFQEKTWEMRQRIGIERTLPYEENISPGNFLEVLDYEKTSALVGEADKLAVSLCACRHLKFHQGNKECNTPLELCSWFGWAAEFAVRRGLARAISKTQMLENIARSKEMKLLLSADNVKHGIMFICHCCKCCCFPLHDMRKRGYPNLIVTSSLIAQTDAEKCTGCGKCARECPVDAIEMIPSENNRKSPSIDKNMCLGCGVCAQACPAKAVWLFKRGQRVIHPETTFERVMLQALQNGKLQHQLFDNPQSITHKYMRGFLGAFLRLDPVRRGLMSDLLRSRFLNALKTATRMIEPSRCWPE